MERINDVAFRLALPFSWKIHNVFHVSLLEKHHPNQINNRTSPRPTPVQVKRTPDIYLIDKIVAARKINGKMQYLVHWKDFSAAERTWEPESSLKKDVPGLVREFKKAKRIS